MSTIEAARWVISGHNNYYLWGPGTCTGAVLLTVGQSRGDVEKSYASVVQVGTTSCRYCIADENDLPIYLGTEPKFNGVRGIWAQTKHFN